ncbi:hypothetical protein SAMN05421858_1440 [Haladaptatus litoreus]|uniref:DUF447 family protein n=1 Tax=Haladaptatus litoreus TaxID=553468 RepID=A0A1N6Y7R8_9EURY|nr:DUF447 domain-containing protein [Haladaptatus litoreus]SIR10556.1 hypothetical protein SAMN05421858_1440 [Haladaptatus litoreus]
MSSRTKSDWPVELRGVTESIVTTLGPNELWNVAALGLHTGNPVTAKTWGNTRTRRNFHRQGGGVVQFTHDPVDFVDATLSIREEEGAILDSADAWIEVEAERVDSGESGGTNWEQWELTPVESEIRTEHVPTVNRGFSAIVEATVAVSRLDVDAYDTAELRARLDYFEEVARKCGGERERQAFDRIRELTEW